MNVTDEDMVKQLIANSGDTFGKIDVMCNNTGTISMKFTEDLAVEDWDKIMDVNANGVSLCRKYVISQMKKQWYGKIINTPSQCSKVEGETLGNYCTSKVAVILLARTLALELAKYNILVNCVCPGNVWTDMTA